MDRPDLDAIEGRLRDIPTCPLYRATAGGLGHPKGLLIWMDDAGDGRFVATVNNNHGDYAGLFANAPADLAALLTYARALETILDGIQRITPGHGWIVDEQRRGVVPYPDMVRAISTEMETLRAERDRLALTLRCERGEWAPEGWVAGGFGAGAPDQWTRQWGEDRVAVVRLVRGRRWRWQTCGWEPAEVGAAPTALEAIEAAGAAIREVRGE